MIVFIEKQMHPNSCFKGLFVSLHGLGSCG